MEHAPRIAFLSEHASPLALLGGQDAGGQNVYVDEVSRNLGRLGYAVDVFTRREDSDVPEVTEWSPGVRVINLLAGLPEPVSKDDVWPLMPAFYDALLHFLMRDGTRPNLVHGNFWMSGWAAAKLKRQFGIPAVHIFHAMGKTKQRHQGSADTSPHGRIAVETDVIGQVDRLIAQCPAERDELVDDYGCDPAKVALIPSAVNVERFRPVPRSVARQRIGLADNGPLIAYVGRMLPRKDVRNIVRALALLTQGTENRERGTVKLMVVGGETHEPDRDATPEIGVLQDLAAELGVSDRVIFVGRRGGGDLRDYYSAGDVVVTTPWYEPFGLTPLEAMACGRPIIGSAVGGITYTVQDGVTGYLVPPRDPAALAARLRDVLAQPEQAEKMGQAARERVEREFTWATVAQRTAALYQSLWRVRSADH